MDDSIILANGIAASLDLKTLYVAASLEKRVFIEFQFQFSCQRNQISLD